MKLTAAIFDLDGTIIENEEVYGKAFKKVLGRLGVEVDDEMPHTGGIGVEENWPRLIKKHNIKTKKTKKELGQETQEEYFKLLDQVKLKDGFIEFVKGLRDSGMKTALATSNTWSVVEKIFDTHRIESYFDSVTTGEEVLGKKPDPDIFIKSVKKLNIEPEECVIFEDSTAGIEAAKRAGIKVIGVARDKEHAKELKDADIVIKDYTQLTPSGMFEN